MQREKNMLKEPAIQKNRPPSWHATSPSWSCCASWWLTCGRIARCCARSGCAHRRSPVADGDDPGGNLREATSVYDSYVAALETGTFEALQAYARNLSERIIPRGVENARSGGIVLLLRDVLGTLTVRQVPDRL